LRFILFENPLTTYSYLTLKIQRNLQDIDKDENV